MNPFTVHCIPWQAGAILLQDVRDTACKMGLIDKSEALPNMQDKLCRHALALGTKGKVIGCARIKPDGCIDRMIVLPHTHHVQIEAALNEILNDYAKQVKTAILPAPRNVFLAGSPPTRG